MGLVELLQIGAVAVAVAALVINRALSRPAEPPPPPEPVSDPDPSPGDGRAPKELIAAWVQFLRSEIADAANALNNRLSAIRTRAQSIDRSRLGREQIGDLEQIDVEIKRANAITAGLLHRVTSFAPDTIPPSLHDLAEAPVRVADILVVEDDTSNREVITRLLQRLGHRVTPARDGIEAFAALEASEYDCVVCDIRMPGLGGRSLFEQVEESMPTHAGRFVFVTGDYTRPGTREFLERSGCPVVPKPYDVDSLLAAIASTLERGGIITRS